MNHSVFEQPGEVSGSRFNIPLKWGLIIALVSCILTTVNFMFMIENYMVFLVLNFVVFIIAVILYWITAVQQRKALDGYIDVKQAFQAVFIAILISNIITTIYGVVYVKLIDPGVFDRIKEATMAFMERMNAPEDRIDQTMNDIDQQMEDSLKPRTMVYSIAKSLIVHSIFGLIIALIVKKPRPVV